MRKLFMSNFGNASKISCYVIKAKYKTVFMVYEDLYMFVLTLFLKGHRVNCWFWSLSGVDTRWVWTLNFLKVWVACTILFIQNKSKNSKMKTKNTVIINHF